MSSEHPFCCSKTPETICYVRTPCLCEIRRVGRDSHDVDTARIVIFEICTEQEMLEHRQFISMSACSVCSSVSYVAPSDSKGDQEHPSRPRRIPKMVFFPTLHFSEFVGV